MCHVLVIEDEWMLAEHVADIARDAGATTVAMADTQRDAVEAAHSRQPDIILSDVLLQEGTGPQAVAAIMAALGPIPVVCITGTPEACQPCDPPALVLTKPVSVAGLTEAIRRLAPV